MFKEIINNINNKYNTIKEENKLYNELLQKTTTFNDFTPISINENKFISPHIIKNITEEAPDINQNKAILIANLIPISETYLNVYYAKEILTNKELFIIPTTEKIWIITKEEYKNIFYDQNNNIKIIKNNIMSKIILFNNILLEINGNTEKIETLIKLITIPTERQNISLIKTKYLCNIIPYYQNINYINSGITIDKNNNIVLHTKNNNYLISKDWITNYEILLDNQTYYSKNNNSKKTITSTFSSCYQISIRITINNKDNIIIPILEPNNYRTKYQSHDTIFQNNLNFALSIITNIENITK